MALQTLQTPGPGPRRPTAEIPAARVRSAVGRFGRRLLAVGGLIGAACGVADENALPPNVADPATFKTPAGAVSYYRGVLKETLPLMLERFLYGSAIFADELTALPVALGMDGIYTGLDSRHNASGQTENSYEELHKLRAEAREARGFLGAYAPDSSPALRAHLYALEGYAELFLADLFCSGIPLSTVDFEADFTLASGSTTEEVYTHARWLFDSALTLGGDSVSVQQFAAVGRGRALLALGQYAAAAAAVAGVPDGFAYRVVPVPAAGGASSLRFLAKLVGIYGPTRPDGIGLPSMGDREGLNGLDYRTSGDPRSAATFVAKDFRKNDAYFPTKYWPTTGAWTYTLASGVEARLVEAEAALPAGSGEWLTKLNALRTDGTFTTQPTADPTDDPANVDTLWNAGSGGVARLRPLADPGPDVDGDNDLRVNLLFRERAFWLYLTGHRQGDLRRLIRQYGRTSESVYPAGGYPGGTGSYGPDVVGPVPAAEQQSNPRYTGCFHLNA